MTDTEKPKRKGPQRPLMPALVHGGAAAAVRITKGTEFTSLALDKQNEVEAELAEDGLEAIVTRSAIRLQVAADLYYDALVTAAQVSDTKRLDTYASKFGWLQSKALLAWGQVKQNQKQSKPALLGVLEDYDNESSE